MVGKIYTIDEIKQLVAPIAQQYGIERAYLFGSYARGEATINSDIDVCVIAPTENKLDFLSKLYITADFDKPVDFILYNCDEWKHVSNDIYSFAYQIRSIGVEIYG